MATRSGLKDHVRVRQGDLAPDAVERIAIWTAEAPFGGGRVVGLMALLTSGAGVGS